MLSFTNTHRNTKMEIGMIHHDAAYLHIVVIVGRLENPYGADDY